MQVIEYPTDLLNLRGTWHIHGGVVQPDRPSAPRFGGLSLSRIRECTQGSGSQPQKETPPRAGYLLQFGALSDVLVPRWGCRSLELPQTHAEVRGAYWTSSCELPIICIFTLLEGLDENRTFSDAESADRTAAHLATHTAGDSISSLQSTSAAAVW